MARTDPQLKLRLPDILKARIEQAAIEGGRSINAEIVYRLERSFSSVDEFIIKNRMAELHQLDLAMSEIRMQREELQAKLEGARGPGSSEQRHKILARLNTADHAIGELEHYRDVLNHDITLIRSGHLMDAIRPPLSETSQPK